MRHWVNERAWKEFAQWCLARGLNPLPAHPWTVAAYARWCEPRCRYRTIVQRIKAIARAHLLACRHPPDRHPTVTRTLRRIEARFRGRSSRAGLFRARDFTERVAGPPPSDAAPPAAGTGKPRQKKRRLRQLRSTPRLVPRRPSGK